MKVETEITLEDLVAFNRYHIENSRFVKRRWDFVKYLGYGVALFSVGSALLHILQGKILSAVISIIIAFLLVTIVGSKLRQYITDIYAKGMYKEGKNKGLIGHREITICDDAIVEESNSGTHATKWQSVEKVIKTEKYIFVYASSVSAYLIPRRIFVNDTAYDELYNLILSKKDIIPQK
jgi:YcxB-like protein